MTDARNLGGNLVRIVAPEPGCQTLARGPYVYRLVRLAPGDAVTIDDLDSYVVYVRHADARAVVGLRGGATLAAGDGARVERMPLTLGVRDGTAEVLVAGTVAACPALPAVRVVRHAEIARVIKPWGHELWITGEHPGFALKQIVIRAGAQTSLQYHRQKRETIVLFAGRARLHYRATATIPNDAVTPADLTTHDLDPVSSVDVPPGVLHRVEAVTDVLFYEASTPHLADVVRVADDTRRPDGLIPAEHAPGA